MLGSMTDIIVPAFVNCKNAIPQIYKNNKASLRHVERLCTETGKLIEHIYSFLIIVERILQKYADKNSTEESE